MKKFSDFLAESIRNYRYNIKINFKPEADTLDKIEQALQKYTVASISTPRSLPIMRVDKDFPGINNPETYVITVELMYPTSSDMVRHTVASLGLALESVVVSNVEHDESLATEESEIAGNTSEQALLDREYPAQDNKKISKENYGDDHIQDFVANVIGSTDQMIPKDLKKKLQDRSGETLNDPKFTIGKKSAMGSNKVNLPVVKSFSR